MAVNRDDKQIISRGRDHFAFEACWGANRLAGGSAYASAFTSFGESKDALVLSTDEVGELQVDESGSVPLLLNLPPSPRTRFSACLCRDSCK